VNCRDLVANSTVLICSGLYRPILLHGESWLFHIHAGVKLDGGRVIKSMMDVEISCLVKDIPEFIEVDLVDLKMGESLHISDLALPDGVESVQLALGEGHVKQLSSFFKISPEQVLVIHDELDIGPGSIRLKSGGGHGGHNGLRDTHAQIGKDYWRLRVGIGHPGEASKVADYVLSRPSVNDEIEINNSIDRAVSEIERIVLGDMQKVMNTLHSQ